ncbi:MAG: DUF4340 domain-containing protein [Akkermansiaceae bacterium]|nr:DUF4340 domain-containing protein [Akkermansiaceae bacterium]
MNKRQVITLWIIAIALGAAVAVTKLATKDTGKSATKRTPGQTLFEDFPAREVGKISIEGAEHSVDLAKSGENWVVSDRGDFPANTATVNQFLRDMKDLEVTQGIEAGPSFAPRFGMDMDAKDADEHGLMVRFSDGSGKELASVALGKNISGGANDNPMMGGGSVGRYVRNLGDESGFYAINEMFSAISAEPKRWLKTDFFSPEKIESVSLSKAGSDDLAWKVVRDGEEAEFKLDGAAANEVLDTTSGNPLKTLFSYARFDDVVSPEDYAERANEEKKRTAVIKTFEGFTYTVTITPPKAKKDDAAEEDAAEEEDDAASSDAHFLTVSVSAEIPKERKKEEGEKEEDAKTKDEAFATRSKELTEKLEKEKALEGRIFEVAKYTVEPLLKKRKELVKKPEPQPAAGSPGGAMPLPGGSVVTPPRPAGGRIEAVTPPIAIPPLDSAPEEKPEEAPEEPAEEGAGE